VFATVNGTPIHRNTLSRAYAKLIVRAVVLRIRFYDLRHTSATLLLASGEQPKLVQERLGHASIREMLDRYSHASADMQQRAAARFDAIFDEVTEDEETGTE
jgi:integrase